MGDIRGVGTTYKAVVTAYDVVFGSEEEKNTKLYQQRSKTLCIA
jgi:hypothetical protein